MKRFECVFFYKGVNGTFEMYRTYVKPGIIKSSNGRWEAISISKETFIAGRTHAAGKLVVHYED